MELQDSWTLWSQFLIFKRKCTRLLMDILVYDCSIFLGCLDVQVSSWKGFLWCISWNIIFMYWDLVHSSSSRPWTRNGCGSDCKVQNCKWAVSVICSFGVNGWSWKFLHQARFVFPYSLLCFVCISHLLFFFFLLALLPETCFSRFVSPITNKYNGIYMLPWVRDYLLLITII